MMNEHVNCLCVPDVTKEVNKAYTPSVRNVLDELKSSLYQTIATPERILKNGNVTVVFWGDGTKTIVKPEPGATLDDYTAFTAALAKWMFGSNSKLKKVIKTHTEYQVKKGKKGEAVPTSGSST